MKEFMDLLIEEQTQVLTQGEEFKHEHHQHVCALAYDSKFVVAPSGSDMLKPELWKGSIGNGL